MYMHMQCMLLLKDLTRWPGVLDITSYDQVCHHEKKLNRDGKQFHQYQ